jgi:hypothetical protein
MPAQSSERKRRGASTRTSNQEDTARHSSEWARPAQREQSGQHDRHKRGASYPSRNKQNPEGQGPFKVNRKRRAPKGTAPPKTNCSL